MKRTELRTINPPKEVMSFIVREAKENDRTLSKQLVYSIKELMKIKSK